MVLSRRCVSELAIEYRPQKILRARDDFVAHTHSKPLVMPLVHDDSGSFLENDDQLHHLAAVVLWPGNTVVELTPHEQTRRSIAPSLLRVHAHQRVA